MPGAVAPARAALVLVDFINLLDFDGARRLAPRAIRAARRTAAFKSGAAARRMPCIYVNDNFGDWTRSFERLVEECLRRKGPSEEIASLLRPSPPDVSILKPRHSAFYGTPLDFLLDELGVKRLVIAGVAADNCVFATAQDAYVRKFKLWIPRDCVAAESAANERNVLRHMARTLKAETMATRNRT
jgi:nicotinamidase-related amidase